MDDQAKKEGKMGAAISVHLAKAKTEDELLGIGEGRVYKLCWKYGGLDIYPVAWNIEIRRAATELEKAVSGLKEDHPDLYDLSRLAKVFRKLADERAFLTSP